MAKDTGEISNFFFGRYFDRRTENCAKRRSRIIIVNRIVAIFLTVLPVLVVIRRRTIGTNAIFLQTRPTRQ